MIPVNELRAGNLFIGVGMIQTVKEILDYGSTGSIQKINKTNVEATPGYTHLILVEENGNQYKPVDMLPIILTPEILQGCRDYDKNRGLQIQPGDYPHGDLFIDFVNNGDCYLQNCSDGYWFGKPIKHFHRLQNLYLDLTEKELTYNPIKNGLSKV